jgi:hypothetical protein
MVSDTRNAPKYFVFNHLNDVKVRLYGGAAVAQGEESWERRTASAGALFGRYLGLASRTLANRGREDLITPESLADT